MKTSQFLYPFFLLFTGVLFAFMLPEFDAEPHDHTEAIQYRLKPFEVDTVQICGDSMYVKGVKHIELTEWRREWIKQEPIVDKPF